VTSPVYNREAEWSVIGQMLTQPNAIPEVIGIQMAVEDFFGPDCRLIFEAAVESYYAGDKVDPVLIGDKLRGPLSRQWGIPEGDIPAKLYEQASARAGRKSLLDHAKIVRRRADERRLLAVMDQARASIEEGEMTPEEVSDFLGSEATKVATGTTMRGEILSMQQVGTEYMKYLRRLKIAREQGIELAAYFGLQFVDRWTKGVAPGELMLVGGEPGVGKSAITWEFAHGFGKRQMAKPVDRRIGALVLCMEMALVGSSARLATRMSGVPGDKLREGILDNDELGHIARSWKNEENLPIFWNFASNFKMSQMRALIVEAIRRHNVGLIVVDHFRMFDPDRRINNPNQEDEAKARFLKEDIAKDLNVAVVCLAHTTKLKREMSDGRPHLGDLRGSGQVAAHADIVTFMYRPWMYATDNEKAEGVYSETDAELLYRKNRNGALGISEFEFDPARMSITDKYGVISAP
jgi:replicative DNA helicase